VTTWFTRIGATSGVEILAANTLLMQLFLMFSFFMDGFAFAGEALAGRFYGAEDSNSLRKCINALMTWGFWLSIVFAIAYYTVGYSILMLLTTDTTVINTAKTYIPWAALVPMVSFVAFIWDGVFVGLTRTRQMLTALFAAMIVFFLILTCAGSALGNHGLWLAFIAYLATRGAVQTILYKHK
jgi:MATE family multidrug resistance protein